MKTEQTTRYSNGESDTVKDEVGMIHTKERRPYPTPADWLMYMECPECDTNRRFKIESNLGLVANGEAKEVSITTECESCGKQFRVRFERQSFMDLVEED